MSRAAKPFSLPFDHVGAAVLLGHTPGKVNGHLGMNQAPVLPASSPLFRDIHHSRIQHFQQTVIGGEYRFGLGHLARLAVEAFNGVVI